MKTLGYYFSLDNASWQDVGRLINTKNTTIQQNLCTTEFKSAVDTASIQLIPAADTTLWASVLSLLMENDRIYAKITSVAGEILFYGVVDKSNIDIESKKIPSSCSISLSDVSTIYLDKTPSSFFVIREKKISEIVFAILDDIGMPYSSVSPITTEDDVTLPSYVIDPDDSDDYRALIDTLLFEHGGYVLNTTANGEAEIVALQWKDNSEEKEVVAGLVETGVKTSTAILDEDGLDLTYYTLNTKENQVVYMGITSMSSATTSGLVSDTDIEADYYYPEDGDLEATYEEYDDSYLDRAYNLKVNRKKNDDLAIVDVTDAVLSCGGYKYKGSGENEELDYSKYYSGADLFDFPVLSGIGMTNNPVYYPTKAWILGKNITGGKVNLQEFTIKGKVLYREKKCKVLLPSSAENPEEYEAETIYTPEVAEKFSQFYWHFKKYSQYISTWRSNGNGMGKLGSLVTVAHKDTDFGQASLVVSTELSFIRPDYIQTSYTAVAVGEYNTYAMKKWGVSAKSNGGIKNINTLYLLRSENVKPTSADTGWTTTASEVSENFPYLFRREIVTYTNGVQEEEIYLSASYGKGASAYDIAREQGYTGTEKEWIESLKGKSPVTLRFSESAHVFQSNAYGVVADTEYEKLAISVAAFQDGVGLSDVTVAAEGENISVYVDTGNIIKMTSGSEMWTDSARIKVTTTWTDNDGETGTDERYISVSKAWVADGGYSAGLVVQYATTAEGKLILDDSGNPTPLGYTMAGVNVSVDENGNSTTLLRADKILLDGSVKAQQIDVDNLMAQSLEIKEGGSIRSSAYDEEGNNPNEDRGFYLNDKGELKAYSAEIHDANMYDITITGGEIRGEDSPLETIKQDTSGSKYRTIAEFPEYYKGSDVYNTFSPATIIYMTDEQLVGTTPVVYKGTTYYVWNLQPEWLTQSYKQNTTEFWDMTSITTWTGTFIFNLPYPNTLVNVSVLVPKYRNYWGYYGDGHGQDHSVDFYVTNSAYYYVDGGSAVTIYSKQGDSKTTWGGINFTYLFSTAGSHTISISAVAVDPPESSDDDTYQFGSRANVKTGAAPVLKWKYNGPTGVYAFKTTTDYVAFNSSFFGNYVLMSDVSYGDDYEDKLANLTSYTLFQGVQRALATTTDGTTTYGDYTKFTDSITVVSRDVTIDGVAQDGYAIITYGPSGLTVSIDKNITQISANTYYTSYPSITWTEIAEGKGTYVTDLYPKYNQDGSYMGEGNIGSTTQKFNAVYAKSLDVETAEIDAMSTCPTMSVCRTITDWNDAYYNGFYMGLSASNAPTSGKWYFGQVICHGNAGWCMQTAYAFADQQSIMRLVPVYRRFKYNGTWSSWQQINKHNSTTLFGPSSFTNTVSLNDSLTNYEWISVQWKANGFWCTPTFFLASNWSSYQSSSSACILTTADYYVRLYFPTVKTMGVVDGNITAQVKVIGYR